MSKPVLTAVHGSMAQLTLNRPESYNAFIFMVFSAII